MLGCTRGGRSVVTMATENIEMKEHSEKRIKTLKKVFPGGKNIITTYLEEFARVIAYVCKI